MQFWSTTNKRPLRGLAGVCERPDGVALARVDRSGDSPRLAICTFLDEATTDPAAGLPELVRRQSLRGVSCVGVMEPRSYSLAQIELPDVPEAEINEAVRWLIKDLLDFPLEEAVIDHFPVPGVNVARSRLGYVVAAPRSAVRRLALLIRQARLRVAAIDIPEMALHQLAGFLPEGDRGVALLYPGRTRSLITVSRRGILYLSRTVGVGAADLTPLATEDGEGGIDPQLTDLLATMVLEVQRSLDFYESHFGQAPVAALAVAPMESPVPGMLSYLQRSLGVPVRSFDLGEIFPDCPLSPAEQSRCLLAVGAALRPELA
ncbi:MAG: hypothetical protein IH614_07860 [Desulfuromonadales bacterium]|nr:hypothetical protein [Desulfuromonadales bacterium]